MLNQPSGQLLLAAATVNDAEKQRFGTLCDRDVGTATKTHYDARN